MLQYEAFMRFLAHISYRSSQLQILTAALMCSMNLDGHANMSRCRQLRIGVYVSFIDDGYS